ncbi:cryptochrome/photolyase family protein [Aeoliella sp. ICT_H6.2]|uniref:Cryptochrome/photolyase family protein n=1 Tax=Aeoliella straminimaris TaxID=2954799 RepID=A0A9X2JHZ9_9BACT|nr:cryptochrome/photolyase family protein [Aeoliella straminimaris]MCO6046002.1 cryptochrome/photolyase family protein [Aeoliella straminimaris]
MAKRTDTRRLVVVLGDQLNADSAVFDDFDKAQDVIWMAEVEDESTHVWTHKARIALFLAAMRHYRDARRTDGYDVDYRQLDEGTKSSLGEELKDAIDRHRPESIAMVQPGEYRVQQQIEQVADAVELPLEVLEDRHFFSTPAEFAEHAKGRKQLRLEFFYRELRKKHQILLEDDGEPIGGDWNYDGENRESFGKKGPGKLPEVPSFRSHGPTQDVLQLVEDRFASHPGELEHFNWPTTPGQAERALDHFIEHRLPTFGQYQDALWTDEPFLYHSLLASSLNLKLLDPRKVVAAAEEAYRTGHAPLASVEGFIRQILGWREYVRGIYWHFMPQYLERNALAAHAPLPEFYWTGDTDMHCLHQVIGQTLRHGYAHHIQRLMVTGLFAMLLGVDPRQVHVWYLAVYVDAVEWVELPNTLGMSQYGDGGIMASKPYCASGAYINRMSNYCQGCRFKPSKATGDEACPFTTLYWDFLARHQQQLSGNNRMNMQLKNLERKGKEELQEIRKQAEKLRDKIH